MSARTKKLTWIRLLKLWKQEVPRYNFTFGKLQNNPDFLKAVYADVLADILTERILNSGETETVTSIIVNYYREMDDIINKSDDDHEITHRFASIMQTLTVDMLRTIRNYRIGDNEREVIL